MTTSAQPSPAMSRSVVLWCVAAIAAGLLIPGATLVIGLFSLRRSSKTYPARWLLIIVGAVLFVAGALVFLPSFGGSAGVSPPQPVPDVTQ
jgi:uncharacterized membrane protein HdeD (DUF308 family)